MSDIFFSLVGPSIRSNLYESFYNNLSLNNKIPFEIVFAGDKKPDKPMPSNFHYIYTKVKPMQCMEISVRRAIGEYVIVVPDDLVFSPEFLNRMYKHIKNNGDKKVIVSPRYSKGKRYDNSILDTEFNEMYFDKNKKGTPMIGICPALKREVWNELGGIDSRFLGTFGGVDLQMRFLEKGYKIYNALDCCVFEIIKIGDFVRLIKRSGEKDENNFLNSLWTDKHGKITNKRNSPLHPFSDKNILVKSQGNKDKSQWD